MHDYWRRFIIRDIGYVFFLLVLNSNASALFEVRVPPDKSTWMTESKAPFSCSLGQYVENIGEAFITVEAGKRPYFDFELPGYSPFKGFGDVSVIASSWSNPTEDILLSSLYKNTDEGVRFQLARPLPSLMNSLSKGMNLRMQLSDQDQPIRVELSSVNINDAMFSFKDCLKDLLPVNYEQINTIRFYYPEKHFRLNESQKKIIRDIAKYVRADSNILGITIDAHTDNGGDRLNNLMLSRRRKEEVMRYFSNNGVDSLFIKASRHHGQRYPAFKNTTEEGRSKNRRVLLKVYRVNKYGRIEPEETELFLTILKDREKAKKEKEMAENQLKDSMQKKSELPSLPDEHKTGTDAGTDTGTDTGTDAGTDAGTDTGTDAGTEKGNIDASNSGETG